MRIDCDIHPTVADSRSLLPYLAPHWRDEILDREAFETGFVQQHILHATTRGGEKVALRVCLVVKMGEDGLIRRIDEYLDPAELAPLL